jgi:uncharacterized protein (TIGR02231 family)
VLQVDTREQRVEAVTAGEPQPLDELPGIDDGGDSITLVAPARVDVPSDGRPQRVALTSFESDATLELTTHPELMSGVVTKATLHNAGAGPLLAGPVDMIRDGGLSCRSALLYVGRGERFDLSFGTEPELRVSRTIEVEHEEGGRLSSWTRLLHHIEIRLSNLGPDRREVSIRERVPVSEVEKVKIVPDPKGTTNHQTPDEDGFVDWDVTLDPFDTATIALRYRIEKHADVIGL